jgi:hypothetical protein
MEEKIFTVGLGDEVKDSITGFSGTISGQCRYVTGCKQALVQPRIKASGDFVDARWFDEDRLELIRAKKVTVKVKDNGADIPAPIR